MNSGLKITFFRKFQSIAILHVVFLALLGCTSNKNIKPVLSNQVSLKQLHADLLETKLASFEMLETRLGKLVVEKPEKPYMSYIGSAFTTQDGYIIRVKDVRVRTSDRNNIIKILLDINGAACLDLLTLAKEHGPSIMQLKEATNHVAALPNGVVLYSTVTNEWGYVNFGFDTKACLKSMSFFKGKP